MNAIPESLRRVLAAKGIGKPEIPVADSQLPFDSERTTIWRTGEVVRESRGQIFQRRSVAPVK